MVVFSKFYAIVSNSCYNSLSEVIGRSILLIKLIKFESWVYLE